jgi:prepilin peptidase CpaA
MDHAILGQLAALGVFPPLLVLAAANDVARLKIPNWVSALLALSFFPMAVLAQFSASAIGLHAAVGAGALVLGFSLFARNWIGAGDAKLFAAIAMWMGWPGAGEFTFVTVLIGGALALSLLLLRKAVAYAPPWPWLEGVERRTKHVPYAVALSGGALIAYPSSSLFLALTH